MSALVLGLTAAGPAKTTGRSRQAGESLPRGSEPVELKPADFTTEIDNPYWPMKPGARWVYREADTTGAEQRVVVTVTGRTKRIANGVEARVVRDAVTRKGVPVEITDDWYAQDKRGNIWYLGEHTVEYKNGKPASTAGSFEAGVDGAQPGIALPANPRPEMSYRQEFKKGEAEDTGAVVTVGQRAGRGALWVLPAQGRAHDTRPGAHRAEGPRAEVLRSGRGSDSEHPHGRSGRACDARELHAGQLNLSVRIRVTLVFALVMGLLLTATGLFLHGRLAHELDSSIDEGLARRAGDISALVRGAEGGLERSGRERAQRGA